MDLIYRGELWIVIAIMALAIIAGGAEAATLTVGDSGIVINLGQPVTGKSNIWALTTGIDGKIYGGTGEGGTLFVHDPNTNLSEHFGEILGEQAVYSLTTDDKGLIYGGTAWNSKLFVYDPFNESMTYLGQPIANGGIICSLVVMDSNIYGSTCDGGDNSYVGSHLFVYNSTARNFTDLGQPVEGERSSKIISGKYGKIYGGTSPNGYLFSYDPVGKLFTTIGKPVKGEGTAFPLIAGKDDKIYFSLNESLYVFDPVKSKIDRLFNLGEFIHVSGEFFWSLTAGLDGNIYGGTAPSGYLFVYNTSDGSVIFGRPLVSETRIRALTTGINGKIYGGTAWSAYLFSYDPIVQVGAVTPMPISAPESRYVWDAALGANLTYTWTPMNFDGFFYDVDNNVGSESLTMRLDSNASRNIQQNNLVYAIAVENISFQYKSWGSYSVIGFMGEKYFAGYTNASTGITSLPISTINSKQLHKILMDENTVRAVYEGSTLTLGEGYVLKVKDVDITGGGIVLLSLLKDGDEVDVTAVSAGQTYVYSKKVGSVSDLPIIAVHIDSVFRGREVNASFIKGIFQISESYASVNTGDRYGVMEITSLSDTGVVMRNANSIDMTQGSTIDIMGYLKLRVADSDILRFYPINFYYFYYYYGDYSSDYERRGAVSLGSNSITAWDALNFAGFWYDLYTGSYSETLKITNLSGRTIANNGLNYTTSSVRTPYIVTKVKGLIPDLTDGTYAAIGFGGDKHAAIKGKTSKLSRILLEQGTSISDNYKKTLTIGEIWDMGGGYTIKAQSIDAKASPRQAWLVLSRNGVKLDDTVVAQGSVYTYVEKSFAGETDVPLLVTYIDSIFAGATSDMVQLRYTWLISNNVTEIKAGDGFGVFNVTNMSPSSIILKNNNSISLSAGSSMELIGNLKLTVADSNDLRFYPSKVFTAITPTPPPPPVVGVKNYTIYLKKGWNLISLPLIPLDSSDKENTSIQRITADISNKIIKIVTYNATAMAQGKPPWEVYYPEDASNSTLRELTTGKGYFIKLNESASLNIYGVRIYENTPRSYSLTKGWNLIGYHSISLLPVGTALYSIQGDFASLWTLDTDWMSYFGGEFNYMVPGQGYWIYMKKEGEIPQN